MQRIEIHTKSRPSAVLCGEGALAEAAAFLAGKEAFVVTDSNVYGLYKETIARLFPAAKVCTVPAGEENKNRETLFSILDAMLEAQLHRSSVVAALGGGVIGDMAGLAAALYMRGARLIQIPTTLLAQVDSSVGGKTAIDHKGVKNVIGAFYQPELVFCDPVFLKTLPPREIKCGLGEIVKTAALEPSVWEEIAANRGKLFDLSFLSSLAERCIRFKARVVAEDEQEKSGVRKCLNMGHTTGHALELMYGERSHGEYVLIGMWLESFIAEEQGVCTPAYARQVRELVSLAEPEIPAFPGAEGAVRFALLDKKNSARGMVDFILPAARGEYAELSLPAEKYAAYLKRLEGRV